MSQDKTIITHEDIQAALSKFREEGGTITKLPDGAQPLGAMMGSKWEAYETVFEAIPFFHESIQRAGNRVVHASPRNPAGADSARNEN